VVVGVGAVGLGCRSCRSCCTRGAVGVGAVVGSRNCWRSRSSTKY
jgi:hypothetical protein